jgi:hypothetical protein
MFAYEKSSSIGHILVLAGLWFVNILIVIFGSPFLLFKKTQELFFKATKKSQPKSATNQKSAQYFPCRIDSNL